MPTPITIKAAGSTIHATLNDTVAARDFAKRLPLTISGHRSSVDYCCSAACGTYDPLETQAGWKNGDISLAGGWLAIFFDGEEESEAYRSMMVIAHIDEEDLDLVKQLPADVKFTVEAI